MIVPACFHYFFLEHLVAFAGTACTASAHFGPQRRFGQPYATSTTFDMKQHAGHLSAFALLTLEFECIGETQLTATPWYQNRRQGDHSSMKKIRSGLDRHIGRQLTNVEEHSQQDKTRVRRASRGTCS
jgi:hypothetical protein